MAVRVEERGSRGDVPDAHGAVAPRRKRLAVGGKGEMVGVRADRLEAPQFFLRREVPEENPALDRRRKPLAVGREGERSRAVAGGLEHEKFLPRLDVVDPDLLVND